MTQTRFGSQLFANFPKGIGSLCLVQIFATLSFSVLYSTLVLYMTQKLGMSNVDANTITGFFIAFNFGLHLIGGYIGGRFISNRNLFSIGMVLLVLGCFVLSQANTTTLYVGLALFLTGSGLNVTCLNCMVTQRFDNNDHKTRERAFFLIYSAMNVGFFSGFTISGILEKSANYPLLFALGGIGNVIALLLVFKNWHLFKDTTTDLSKMAPEAQKKRKRVGLLMVLAMIPCILGLIHYATLANRFVMFVGAMVVVILATLSMQQPSEAAKKKMFAFILLMLASMVFWTLYQIAPMGLTLFVKHNVLATIWGVHITPQWVQNVNTIVIVIGGPLLSSAMMNLRERGVNVNIPAQFVVSLLLIGLAFVILTVGISYANAQGYVNLNWVILSYVLQSLGELLISPVGYAMIGQLAPNNLQGVMMGSWMMVTGVSATLSNYFSNMMVSDATTNNPLLTNGNFSHVFSLLGWSAIAASGLLLLLVPFIKRLIDARDTDTVEEEVLDAEPA